VKHGESAVESAGEYGVSALGSVGGFTLEILNRADGDWLLSIEAPSWCFAFGIAGPTYVSDLEKFLRSGAGQTEFSELVVGLLGGVAVRFIKDDEFSDRLFIRAANHGLIVEFTIAGATAIEFTNAVSAVVADLD
jgi:hypothetical protein